MNPTPYFFKRQGFWLFVLLSALLGSLLQYQIWQEWPKIKQYDKKITAQKQENQRLLERNKQMEWEIKDLKEGLEATEELARYSLGMIKKDETLYYIPHD